MRHGEARLFLEVHHASVRGIAVKDYPPAVIEAWARLPITDAMIEGVLANPEKEVRLVAEINGEIVGIGSVILETSELRACYVLPSAARKGVGSAIVREIEQIAQENGLVSLHFDASVTSEPFYKGLGYEVLEHKEHILSSGQRMPCVKMQKLL